LPCGSPAYDTLKTILCNTESAKFSSTGVTSQILSEEQHRIRTSGGNAAAFYAKKAKRGDKPDKHKNNVVGQGGSPRTGDHNNRAGTELTGAGYALCGKASRIEKRGEEMAWHGINVNGT
jgi:hypothetical protein